MKKKSKNNFTIQICTVNSALYNLFFLNSVDDVNKKSEADELKKWVAKFLYTFFPWPKKQNPSISNIIDTK